MEVNITKEAAMNTRIERVRQFDKITLDYLFKRSGDENAEPNSDFFKDEKNILLVSRTDGKLSGFLWAHVLLSPHTPYPKMLLYSIDVFTEFRRHGIGSQLIYELKDIARMFNCRAMFVPTRKSNLPAMGLYKKTQGKVENEDGIIFTYEKDTLNK
jgi:ribosomal protein S18 acetylase RimI-like enzyme